GAGAVGGAPCEGVLAAPGAGRPADVVPVVVPVVAPVDAAAGLLELLSEPPQPASAVARASAAMVARHRTRGRLAGAQGTGTSPAGFGTLGSGFDPTP